VDIRDENRSRLARGDDHKLTSLFRARHVALPRNPFVADYRDTSKNFQKWGKYMPNQHTSTAAAEYNPKDTTGHPVFNVNRDKFNKDAQNAIIRLSYRLLLGNSVNSLFHLNKSDIVKNGNKVESLLRRFLACDINSITDPHVKEWASKSREELLHQKRQYDFPPGDPTKALAEKLFEKKTRDLQRIRILADKHHKEKHIFLVNGTLESALGVSDSYNERPVREFFDFLKEPGPLAFLAEWRKNGTLEMRSSSSPASIVWTDAVPSSTGPEATAPGPRRSLRLRKDPPGLSTADHACSVNPTLFSGEQHPGLGSATALSRADPSSSAQVELANDAMIHQITEYSAFGSYSAVAKGWTFAGSKAAEAQTGGTRDAFTPSDVDEIMTLDSPQGTLREQSQERVAGPSRRSGSGEAPGH
jgi:hypothetical protein